MTNSQLADWILALGHESKAMELERKAAFNYKMAEKRKNFSWQAQVETVRSLSVEATGDDAKFLTDWLETNEQSEMIGE